MSSSLRGPRYQLMLRSIQYTQPIPIIATMAAELNQKSITIAEVSTTVSIVSAAKVKPTTGSASAATDDTVTCFSRGTEDYKRPEFLKLGLAACSRVISSGKVSVLRLAFYYGGWAYWKTQLKDHDGSSGGRSSTRRPPRLSPQTLSSPTTPSTRRPCRINWLTICDALKPCFLVEEIV
jgi:hypothetical protein